MKAFKLKLPIILLVTTIFSSCITASYIGDTLTPTASVDVYYAAKDVKREYKVIGHISVPEGLQTDGAKLMIIEKAKAVGANGVIITGSDSSGGKNSATFYKADAIKYTN